MADNTILIKNAFILDTENNIEGKKDLLIKNY
jgi:formylmethanofuran dehydrogenase subunit A